MQPGLEPITVNPPPGIVSTDNGRVLTLVSGGELPITLMRYKFDKGVL